jgi:hypothetical protein
MLIAGVCLGVVLGGPGPGLGLLAAVAVPAPYVIVSGVSPQRLGTFGLPQAWAGPLSDPLLRWCRLAERLRDDRARPGVKAASQGGRPADSRLSAISGAFLLGSRARSQCAPRGRFCRNPAVVRSSVLVRVFRFVHQSGVAARYLWLGRRMQRVCARVAGPRPIQWAADNQLAGRMRGLEGRSRWAARVLRGWFHRRELARSVWSLRATRRTVARRPTRVRLSRGVSSDQRIGLWIVGRS